MTTAITGSLPHPEDERAAQIARPSPRKSSHANSDLGDAEMAEYWRDEAAAERGLHPDDLIRYRQISMF